MITRPKRWLLLIVPLALFFASGSARAASATPVPIILTPEISIPFFNAGPINGLTLAKYIQAIFITLVSGVGVLGVTMIVFGGIRWIVAAGNSSRINDAKETIQNAIIGIIIALSSVAMFTLISPELTSLKSLALPYVVGQEFKDMIPTVEEATKTVSFSCKATLVGGIPDTATPNSGQLLPANQGKLNAWVNTYSFMNGKSVDPILVKAIMAVETGGSFRSQPAGVPESKGATRLSSSYGLGQFINTTLAALLLQEFKSVTKVPSECAIQKGTHGWFIPRETNGSLNVQCQRYLDDHLELQVKLVGRLLGGYADLFGTYDEKTKLMAMAYNQGENLIELFVLSGQTTLSSAQQQENINDAIVYINKVKKYYDKFCALSPVTTTIEYHGPY